MHKRYTHNHQFIRKVGQVPMNVQRKEKGFTIIEVVLVLAIAGLIFLMVFIALPALQRSQRDTARKNDVSSIASAITTYTSNNRGSFPSTAALTGDSNGAPDSSGKFGGYVDAVSNNTTSIKVNQNSGSGNVSVSDGQVVVTQSSTCGDTGAASNGSATQALNKGSARQFTVVTYIEAGGGSSYCQDS